jgi:predicted amidohydrolase YtcJ
MTSERGEPAGATVPIRAVTVESGSIAELGESAAALRRSAPAGAEVLEFPGGFVRPGFWDTHIHIARTGAAVRAGPLLYEARSVAEVVERLADFAGRHPELPAIVARAGCLDERVLAEGRLPRTWTAPRAPDRSRWWTSTSSCSTPGPRRRSRPCLPGRTGRCGSTAS